MYHDIHVVGVVVNLRAKAHGTGEGERDSSVPRHSCRRCVMENLRAEAHGTYRRYMMENLRAEAHGTGERDSSVPRHLWRGW